MLAAYHCQSFDRTDRVDQSENFWREVLRLCSAASGEGEHRQAGKHSRHTRDRTTHFSRLLQDWPCQFHATAMAICVLGRPNQHVFAFAEAPNVASGGRLRSVATDMDLGRRRSPFGSLAYPDGQACPASSSPSNRSMDRLVVIRLD